MIAVDRLTKRYGETIAVNEISFRVKEGEVVGFLGPNGAGKSTTMRILTCFMPATSGVARVAGWDVFTQGDKVRASVGYMPENNPLYPDMRVREYLAFRARIKNVPRNQVRKRVDEVLERVGAADVADRIIGQLSKGYRQRVGLADALVHDPQLLILDEPTIGLDPNQIRQVRALIKELAGQRTVLLSTHILPEVEAVCSRAIIINEGRIVADEPVQRRNAVLVEVAGPAAEVRRRLEGLSQVTKVQVVAQNGTVTLDIEGRDEAELADAVSRAVFEGGWGLRQLRPGGRTLEDRFVEVTAKEVAR